MTKVIKDHDKPPLRTLRIALVTTGLQVGGAEVLVIGLANHFAARGHAVWVISLTGKAEVLPSHPAVHLIELGMRKTITGSLKGFIQLCRILAETRPDIVHSHMFHANVITRLTRLLVREPRLICTAHNSHEGGWLHMLAYRLTHKLADCSTNVSEEAVAIFEKKNAVPRGGMIAMHNGIDLERFKPNMQVRDKIRQEMHIESYCPVFLAVGRLVPQKDYPNLLQAFHKVIDKKPNAKLWIVGQGPLKEQLIAMAQSLKISEAVTFLGVRRDIPDLMNSADVFVLSSRWEGFGLVVAEAMAVGLLVIATNSGGVAEVMGDSGRLVPIACPTELANEMLKAIQRPDEEIKIRDLYARRRIVEKFSLDSRSDEWITLYQSFYREGA